MDTLTALQQKIERKGTLDKSSKVRQALNQIFRYAIARGICDSNSAAELRYIAETPESKTPYPHLLEEELPDFLRALDFSTGRKQTIIASKMCLLTASHPGMVVKSEWTHVNLELAFLVVPDRNMKIRKQHVVPLPSQLVELLEERKQMTGRSKHLFPSIGPKSPTMSTDSINKMLRGIGYKGRLTGHGSRHTASTLLHEHGWNPRRIMMQWYADYFDALRGGMSHEQKAAFQQRAADAMLRYQPAEHTQPAAA